LHDHGGLGGDFRVDTTIHPKLQENIRHTKEFLHSRLDQIAFKKVWQMCHMVVEWDQTFSQMARTVNPAAYYYLTQVFTNMMFQAAKLVLAEKALNPGVKWALRMLNYKWVIAELRSIQARNQSNTT
jgi:hypothetical protein